MQLTKLTHPKIAQQVYDPEKSEGTLNMKYLKIALFIILLLNITQIPVWAVTSTLPARLTTAPTRIAAREDTRLTNIKARADKMIDTRIADLQKLLSHVTSDSKLPASDQSAFTSDINTTISNLQALKTKIDADTDLTTAITDTKSIVTSYRIYLIYEPKLRLMIAVDNLTTLNQKLASLSGNLTTLISNLKSQGKDVTSAQNALTDLNTKLTDANNKLSDANIMLKNITISQAGQQPFVTIKQDLAAVRQDYAAIRHDLAQIRTSLKVNPSLTPHPTEKESSSSAH